jgi:hypothetical protein
MAPRRKAKLQPFTVLYLDESGCWKTADGYDRLDPVPPLPATPGLSKEQIARGKAQGIPVEELQEVLDGYQRGVVNYSVDQYLNARVRPDESDVENESDEPVAEVKLPVGSLSKLDSKKGRVQRACLELMRQHEADGSIPTNGRFVYYEIIQHGILPKHYFDEDGRKKARQPAADVTEALTVLRKLGLIPWIWIEDETREIAEWLFAPTVAEYVKDAVKRARIDAWAGKPAPLIICESRATKGVLEHVAREYLAPIAPTNGQCGGFLRTDIIPKLRDNERVKHLPARSSALRCTLSVMALPAHESPPPRAPVH